MKSACHRYNHEVCMSQIQPWSLHVTDMALKSACHKHRLCLSISHRHNHDICMPQTQPWSLCFTALMSVCQNHDVGYTTMNSACHIPNHEVCKSHAQWWSLYVTYPAMKSACHSHEACMSQTQTRSLCLTALTSACHSQEVCVRLYLTLFVLTLITHNSFTYSGTIIM